MKSSITKKNLIKFFGYTLSIVFWIIVWHIAAISIDKEIFLPTPGKVFSVLINELLPSETFKLSLLNSLLAIGKGFLFGALLGITLAILSYLLAPVKVLLWFPIKVIKSVPVASFVILSLLWMDTEQLATFIPALMVLPTLYINTLTGLKQTGDKLLNMATLFNVPVLRRIRYIYFPSVLPYTLSACSLSIGMAWKSGIAAEIIGLAKDSIGNELYKAKLYLMIPELFAWTIVIVLLSIICEHIIKAFIRRA